MINPINQGHNIMKNHKIGFIVSLCKDTSYLSYSKQINKVYFIK